MNDVRNGKKGGIRMLVKKIDPKGTLGTKELETIKAKLRNADEISMVPINVAGDTVTIGCDWSEFESDWEFVHRLVSRKGATHIG